MRYSLLGLILIILLSPLLGFAQVGFIENKGQFDSQVFYEAEYHHSKIFLDQKGFTVLLFDEEKWEEIIEEYHHHDDSHKKHKAQDDNFKFHAIKYEFVGADLSNHYGVETSSSYYNYFLGADKSKWASKVQKHFKVIYKDIYPNIDLEFEAIDQRFKYNFILNQGADINDIKLKINGADKLKINPEQLSITTRFGKVNEIMPISYVINADGSENQVHLEYIDRESHIGFNLKSDIHNSQVMVIDPELIFSTYAGNSVDNFGFTATYDQHGNLYAGGIASSPSKSLLDGTYPVTAGAFDVTFNGGQERSPAHLKADISISKYDSSGSQLIYATYLGGADDEYPHSLIVDKNDNLVVFGTSYSPDFPTSDGAPFPLKKPNGTDLIITKFNAEGSDLIGSTYFGGSGNDGLNSSSRTRNFYADDFRGEVNIDSLGNVIVVTTTNSIDAPTDLGSFQPLPRGLQDGIIVSLTSDLDQINWSSYFGGSGDDAIYSIDFDKNNDFYISGGTSSSNLAGTNGAFQKSYQGGSTDGFIAKISSDGSSLIRTTYYGTSRYDQVLSLELDNYGNVFVVGQSSGPMPTKGNVHIENKNSGQFITKFDATLSNKLLSTVFGSGSISPDITINAFLVDECGKIFVSGWGGNINVARPVPMKNMPITKDAYQPNTDGNDFYLIVFRKDAKEILYATYFGGDLTDDHVDGGTSRFDKRGIVYQSVCSSCPTASDGQSFQISDFPTTTGAFSEKNYSPRCSNASFKLSFGNLNRPPNLPLKTYRAKANDTTEFSYLIQDPDEDTVQVWLSYPAEFKSLFINPEEFKVAEENVQFDFTFTPLCEHIGDTVDIPVYALDIGCPEAKDSSSFIRIIVDPPPPIPPPEVICLNFIGKDRIKLDWSSSPPSKYFSKLYLHKIWPDGKDRIIDTFYSLAANQIIDANLNNPRVNNYSYYLVVEDICGFLGPTSYIINTVKESESPVAATYLKTVTVEQDKLKIEWLRSEEDDFGHYEIYKNKRGSSALPEYITSVSDVDSLYMYDEDVDIDHISYCYYVKVSDKCGNLSKFSNIGCSIVLTGESTPYKFDLSWHDYVDWAGDVYDYQLLRSVDTGVLRPIVRVNHPSTIYTDEDLDLDWGGYWFSVLAYEGPGSEFATSRSNNIYLIQPPVVYVPNAFTPNGDDLNEVFGWSDAFVLGFKMSVYNRWGEKVFETTDKNADWNGIYKDNGLKNSNVYIWVVEYTGWDNSQHIDKGTVTILR